MTAKYLVVDANILIRAVLGVRVAELIGRYGEGVSFCAPDLAFDQAANHLPEIAARKGLDEVAVLEALDSWRPAIDTVPTEDLEPLRGRALKRIGRRDPSDWPFVAAALALDCLIVDIHHDWNWPPLISSYRRVDI